MPAKMGLTSLTESDTPDMPGKPCELDGASANRGSAWSREKTGNFENKAVRIEEYMSVAAVDRHASAEGRQGRAAGTAHHHSPTLIGQGLFRLFRYFGPSFRRAGQVFCLHGNRVLRSLYKRLHLGIHDTAFRTGGKCGTMVVRNYSMRIFALSKPRERYNMRPEVAWN